MSGQRPGEYQVSVTLSKYFIPLLTALMVVLSLLFTIAFVYEFIDAKQVASMITTLQEAIEQNTKLQEDSALVAASTAKVLGLVTTGYQESNRSDFGRAKKNAEIAEDYVRQCRGQVGTHSSLQHSMDLLLASGLTLKARCCYFLAEYNKVRNIAQELEKLDEDDWNAYHFHGMAAMEEYRRERRDELGAEARDQLEKSLVKRSEFTPDYFNLEELLLLMGDYPGVITRGEEYLRDYPEHNRLARLPKPKASKGLCLVADAYMRIANVMLDNNDAVLKLRMYNDMLAETKFDLRNAYDSHMACAVLREIEARLIKHKIGDDGRTEVKRALELLIATSPTE